MLTKGTRDMAGQMAGNKGTIRTAMRRAFIAACLLSCVLPLAAMPVQAQTTDSIIEGAKLCTRQLPRYEREYGIPTHLLSAIASTESGRYHKGLKIKLPWPWTINADGAGYYFDSKAEAIAKVRKLQAQGVKSIDIGCMQVNLVHHPMAFASLEEAFDPEHNVAYAASFLRSIYQEEHSWKKAAAYYHSRTPARGGEYVGHVYNSWYTIVDKLRMAQVEVPANSIMAMNDMKRAAYELKSQAGHDTPYGAKRVYNARQGKTQGSAPFIKVARLPEQQGRSVSPYRSPRMNSIKVTTVEPARRDSGLIVVTPDIKVVDQDGSKVASNIPASQASGESPRVIHVAQAATPATTIAYHSDAQTNAAKSPAAGTPNMTVRRQGPTFIFND